MLAGLLDAALVAEPPQLARDGGFVADGHDPELDETRRLRDEGRGVIGALQAEYVRESGIGSLKIRHNNVLGYFVETPASHAGEDAGAAAGGPVRASPDQRRGRALHHARAGGDRDEDPQRRRPGAGDREGDLRVAGGGGDRSGRGRSAAAARAIAEIDLAAALADLARIGDWTRPEIRADRAFEIVGGRHPVVEAALRRSGESFVANDCDLGADGEAARPLWLITGPNMAGKSTFLRQNALIALLAQMGAYVPATSARIGVVDALFSRVGAADDLARGRSTFMVEMVETAAILNQAGERALVILDEIGRGTATYDGLSIAWAVLEHLHDVNRCRALFATHYHELTALAGKLAGLRNATVAVREWEGEVIFLHEVREGAADRSYGVQVARLAGLPAAVVARAHVVLDALEAGERESGGKAKALVDDLPLFSAARTVPTARAAGPSAVEARLSEVLPDELNPREALALVYELRELMRE